VRTRLNATISSEAIKINKYLYQRKLSSFVPRHEVRRKSECLKDALKTYLRCLKDVLKLLLIYVPILNFVWTVYDILTCFASIATTSDDDHLNKVFFFFFF